MNYNDIDFENLGRGKFDEDTPFLTDKMKKRNTYVSNIFGGNKEVKIEPYINTDKFYNDMYEYYSKGGFWTIIMSDITEIFSLIFGIIFILFVFILLDWDKLLDCELHNCGELYTYIKPSISNVFYMMIFILSICFTIGKIFLFFYNLPSLRFITNFYENNLKITSSELQTMSWTKVINEMGKNQKINLSILNITNRILRKENYYIALIDKDIIGISNIFYTRQLDINLRHIILSNIESNLDERHEYENRITVKSLKKKFILYGILNLLLSLFIFVYLLLYFIATNIDEWYTNKNIGTRKYSLFYEWKFREYNELKHFFKKRLNKSIRYSYEYIKQFPSPVLDVICKFFAFISGSFICFFLVLSLLNENVLLYVHIHSRALIFYAGIFGAISATVRKFIKSPEDTVYDPNKVMSRIYTYTHFIPDHWNNRCNSYKIRDEFLGIFPYTIILYFYELFSVILTPLILIFIMPRKCKDIVLFLRTKSVDIENVGRICSYAHFETPSFDKRMENSLIVFNENHSIEDTQRLSIIDEE